MRDIDPVIFFCAVGLSAFGVVMVYSASHILALDRYGDSLFFVKRHAAWALVGFGLMLAISRLDPAILPRLSFPILVVSVAALALVFVPGLGRSAGGARRWVAVGPLSVQPAEIAKLGLVVFLSCFLQQKEERLRDLKYGFLPPALITGLILFLVLAQPDLGTAILIAAIAGFLLFLAGTRWRYLAGCGLISAPVLYALIFSVPWRQRRILAFLDPFNEVKGTGYQLVQSLLALGRGGIGGLGLGQGKQKLFYLPEPHTDFIYAVVGEELGLVGTLAVALVFALLLWRGFQVAAGCAEPFKAYLAAGVTVLVVLQGLLNMAVATGLVPTTGVPLPLVSLGGTSMVTIFVALGLLLSVAAHNRRPRLRPTGAAVDAARPGRRGRIARNGRAS